MMVTTIYSILHLFVDGICAFAMFGYFANAGYEKFLVYNFCAFALQMPFGALLDSLAIQNKRNYPMYAALLGVFLTLLGVWIHPTVLGLGNALFHVGAGVSVIHQDSEKGWRGQGLGVFVAPGALGLFIGTQVANLGVSQVIWILSAILMGILSVYAWKKDSLYVGHVDNHNNSKSIGVLLCCVLVVILRSYVGMAVDFSWKTTILANVIGVLAVVLGKVAGGILAVQMGIRKTVAVSLLLSTLCYSLSTNMIFGVLALFLFNMTMPITLFLLVREWKHLPGFSFGLLTFALFLGFLPVYIGWEFPVAEMNLGAIGSVLSLLVLLIALKFLEKEGAAE